MRFTVTFSTRPAVLGRFRGLVGFFFGRADRDVYRHSVFVRGTISAVFSAVESDRVDVVRSTRIRGVGRSIDDETRVWKGGKTDNRRTSPRRTRRLQCDVLVRYDQTRAGRLIFSTRSVT